MIILSKKYCVTAVALVLGPLASLLPAATVTSGTSLTAPNEGIIQSFVPGGGSAGWSWRADSSLGSDSWRDTGQSFTAAADFSLTAITLRSNVQSGTNAPALNAPFTLTLYRFTDVFQNTPAETLATYTGLTPSGNLENGNLAAGSYLTFSLSEEVSLIQGFVYGFVFHYEGEAAGRTLAFNVTTNTSEYADGRNLSVLVDSEGNPVSAAFTRSGNSMEFYLIGSSIPEPSAAAFLLGAGVLALGCLRRSSRR